MSLGASGPLVGVRVLEFAGLGPPQHAALLLADMGADVVRIERTRGLPRSAHSTLSRGRTSVEFDLKDPADVARCWAAIGKADVLIEGYRPGVMERLGFGPQAALEANPRLIYGRMTGWGQTGPLAMTAGHDINYIAIAGALAGMGTPGEPPPPPMNLVGDFGGGSLYLIMGVVAALYERERSGLGQVIDAAIVDGVASMMVPYCGLLQADAKFAQREHLPLGGVAAHYRSYACADGRFISVGPLEPQFHKELLERLGLPPELAGTPQEVDALAASFRERTRDEWAAHFEGSDACVAPVLDLAEAQQHPHLRARETYVMHEGMMQSAPAPRFSRTPGAIQSGPCTPGVGGAEQLKAWGAEG
jgi:alpha-methylacyl-CoA racemase